MTFPTNSASDLRLVLLEMAIRNAEFRGFHVQLTGFVRMAVAMFFVLLVVRCFGSLGGPGLDATIAVLFVVAGFVSRVVDPAARAVRHARVQKDAYDTIARLDGIRQASAAEMDEIAARFFAIRDGEPVARKAVEARTLRAARMSMGLSADGSAPKIVIG
jgi:hypothetical protein